MGADSRPLTRCFEFTNRPYATCSPPTAVRPRGPELVAYQNDVQEHLHLCCNYIKTNGRSFFTVIVCEVSMFHGVYGVMWGLGRGVRGRGSSPSYPPPG